MSEQEMQFADPAWQPPQEPYTPQPINKPTSNQPQLQSPSAPAQQEQPYTSASYTGYQAPPLYARPQQQRRRWHPLLWVVLAFLIIVMMSGGRIAFDGFGGHMDFRHKYTSISKPQPPQHYSLGIHPTIFINDPYGSIHVHTGASPNDVAIQTNQDGSDANLSTSHTGNSLNITVNSAGDAPEVDINVTVANEADLVLHTNSGDIGVNSVNGQLTLTSDSGNITASQVALDPKSSLQTNSGSITFDGLISSTGTYQFQSDSGSINLVLPHDASFIADATTTGSIDSDFPKVNGKLPNSYRVNGNGSKPPSTLTITSNSGSINLHERS